MAAAQAQQQGNPNIIPLMHSLAQFMPQMAVAHSAPQAPSMMSPGQPAAPLPMPAGFPNFMLGNSSPGAAPMPWPLVSQPPGSTFQVVPPPAAPPAAPAPLPTPAASGPQAPTAAALQSAQQAEAVAHPPAAASALKAVDGGAFSALLEDAADAPAATDAVQQQFVQAPAVAQAAEEDSAVPSNAVAAERP